MVGHGAPPGPSQSLGQETFDSERRLDRLLAEVSHRRPPRSLGRETFDNKARQASPKTTLDNHSYGEYNIHCKSYAETEEPASCGLV